MEIYAEKRAELKPHAHGTMIARKTVNVPDGYIGILSVRKKYARKGIFTSSQILHSGWKGQPELHVYNFGLDTVEFSDKEAVFNLVFVKAHSFVAQTE